MRMKLTSAVATLTLLAILGTGASSAEMLFETHVSGEAVVPPTDSTAGGVATLMVSADYSEAGFTLNFAGLESPQVGAAFVSAAPGNNGDVLFELPLGSPVSGVWVLDAEDVAAILNETLAVIITTEAYPEFGEVRGDFIPTMVATDDATWSDVKNLYR
jgi:hypothetical protein